MSIELIKQLRELTGLSVIECKKALEQAKFDLEKAKAILKARAGEFAAKKAERATNQGIVTAYIHPNKKTGVLLTLLCETDFVAKNNDFQELAHELTLQLAALNAASVSALLEQSWIKDSTKSIKQLVQEYIAKVGENIKVGEFKRFTL